MSGVALCRLPTQLCEGCGEATPDEDLEVLYSDSLDLYCPACVFERQAKADKARDEDFYGA